MNAKMDFGSAMRMAQLGAKVRRDGWNNAHNVVIFVPGSAVKLAPGSVYARHVGDGAALKIAPHFDLLLGARIGGADDPASTVQYLWAQPGWLASQADMLTDDWYVVQS